jgi:hypothetical protein
LESRWVGPSEKQNDWLWEGKADGFQLGLEEKLWKCSKDAEFEDAHWLSISALRTLYLNALPTQSTFGSKYYQPSFIGK